MNGDGDYESGPFCRHWDDPSSCDIICTNCGHRCTEHSTDFGHTVCEEDGCDCDEWVEPSDELDK